MTTLSQLEKLGKALGDRTRLRILMMLRGGPLCVCQMTAVVGLATASVSRHLSVLSDAELLTQDKQGRWIFYALSDRGRGLVEGEEALVPNGYDQDPQVRGDQSLLARITAVPAEELCAIGLDAVLDKHRPPMKQST